MRIIAATHNKGKLAEFYELVKQYNMELVSQKEAGIENLDVEETGITCEENSLIKAKEVCRITGEPAIADDSGLFVDALNGEPGVHSARYAGEDCNDADNRAKLLEKLKGIPFEKRTAYFASVITIVWPDGKVLAARGECHGHICEEERGDRGFGYDSVFIPEGSDKTFAQLPIEYKNGISHRALALKELGRLFK